MSELKNAGEKESNNGNKNPNKRTKLILGVLVTLVTILVIFQSSLK